MENFDAFSWTIVLRNYFKFIQFCHSSYIYLRLTPFFISNSNCFSFFHYPHLLFPLTPCSFFRRASFTVSEKTEIPPTGSLLLSLLSLLIWEYKNSSSSFYSSHFLLWSCYVCSSLWSRVFNLQLCLYCLFASLSPSIYL